MSRDAVKEAIIHHTIDNEALAEALINYTTQLFIRGVADYLQISGYPDAAKFLNRDVGETLRAIDSMNPEYLTDD